MLFFNNFTEDTILPFLQEKSGDGAQAHGEVPAGCKKPAVTVVQQDPADFLRGRFAAFRADTADGKIGQYFIQIGETDPCPAGSSGFAVLFMAEKPLQLLLSHPSYNFPVPAKDRCE